MSSDPGLALQDFEQLGPEDNSTMTNLRNFNF